MSAPFLNFFKKKYPFHPLVWYIIIETAIARTAFFMVMPFVALQMDATAGSSAATIGLVVGFGPLVSTIIGFYVGHISDLIGRRAIMLGSMILWGGVFLSFSFASTPFAYAILLALNGLARGVFEPVATALLSDLSSGKGKPDHLRESAFHLRYFSINIGAAIGPLIGASLLVAYPVYAFRIAAGIYFLSAITFKIMSDRLGVKALEKAMEKSTHTFVQALNVIGRDRILQLYLLAFFFMSVTYSQFDSMFPLYMKQLFREDGITILGRLLSLNGIGVVLFTMPLLKFAKRFNVNRSCAVSCLVWGLGYLGYGLVETEKMFVLSTLVLTLGEIVVYANGYYMIESLAPKNMKGAYLGSANLAHIGVVIGPMIGGYLYEFGGGKFLFVTMSLLTVFSAAIYFRTAKMQA